MISKIPRPGSTAALIFAAAMLFSTAAPASFEEGMAAFQAEQFSDARRIWEQAAESGDRRAQYELGRLYELGKGRIMRRDYAEAIRWYEAAAAQAHPQALFALGKMAETGMGMRQNYEYALRYYGTAVIFSHHPESHFALAQMYFHGRGVPQDYHKAIENYIAAARRGYPPAQYVYGALLEQGWGIKQDMIMAYAWYGLAARADPKILEAVSSNFDARSALETVRRKLSEHDLDKAEKTLRNWIKMLDAAQNPPE